MTANGGTCSFLTDTYETEIQKIAGIWRAFPPTAMDYRPHDAARTVIEQMEHQVESEADGCG